MCEEIGASLVDMDKVQLHPTSFIDPKDPHNPTKYLGPEALRGSGGLLINQVGIDCTSLGNVMASSLFLFTIRPNTSLF